jgi:chromate reductase
MTKPKIVAFAGSLRKDSHNKKLATIAAKGAEAAGAEVTLIELDHYPLPLYNQDDEQASGIPENGKKIKELLAKADGFLIASPEYNSSITAALKNMIDWASRPLPGEPNLHSFNGKVAILMSASPGGLGGIRGLVHLKSILGNINMILLPQQKCIPNSYNAFDEKGNLKDKEQHEAILQLGRTLTEFLVKLKKV